MPHVPNIRSKNEQTWFIEKNVNFIIITGFETFKILRDAQPVERFREGQKGPSLSPNQLIVCGNIIYLNSAYQNTDPQDTNELHRIYFCHLACSMMPMGLLKASPALLVNPHFLVAAPLAQIEFLSS
jgi:hypothetical protein